MKDVFHSIIGSDMKTSSSRTVRTPPEDVPDIPGNEPALKGPCILNEGVRGTHVGSLRTAIRFVQDMSWGIVPLHDRDRIVR